MGLATGSRSLRSPVAFLRRVWWDAELWNKSVDRCHVFDPDDNVSLGPLRQMSLDYATGDVDTAGRADPRYLLLSTSDVRFAPQYLGSPIAGGDLTLYRTPLPYRAAWASHGVSPDGWTAGSS